MFERRRGDDGRSQATRGVPGLRKLVAGSVLAVGLAPCALALGATSAGAATPATSTAHASSLPGGLGTLPAELETLLVSLQYDLHCLVPDLSTILVGGGLQC